MRITRQDLFVLVWTYPMKDAARKCGCSNVYLRRLCDLKAIPVPPQGYWNCKPANQEPLPRLPPLPPGESQDIWIGEGQTRRLFRSGGVQPEPNGVRWITREDLHEAVCTHLLPDLAKRWRFPEDAIEALCRTLKVPRPRKCYWQIPPSKRAAHRPPLPPPTKGAPARAQLLPCARQPSAQTEAVISPDVAWLLERYFSEHVAHKVVSKGQQTAGTAQRYLLEHFGAMEPAEITPAHVRAYKQRRLTGELCGQTWRYVSEPTIRRELGVLIAALNYAAREGYIRKADIPSIPLPSAGEPRQRWLTEAELAMLFAAAKAARGERLSRVERFIYLAYYTGGRRGALEQLEWSQVDFEAGLIHLQKPGAARTKKRRASVPIHPQLLTVLQQAAGERLHEPNSGLSPWVLDHPGAIRSAFYSLVASLGMRDVSPHVLRHTAATHMLRKGVPVWQTAGVLGNTATMIERTYGHYVPDALRSAVEKL